ncbi:hypothetical protein ALI22I_20535 [Saccharothrix sp. ALI-22-I]|uniref:hypothetical protein n=1 Tax=Saccharothrix sp. ALI-22-I TaxID=1933778 RepID=UPI00097CBCF2|nr:hypothetical protein [Saccharothrix sp. ALI-22-I]ONI88127.1 hypothetical protein ALI22I_20535 [Saccharothrix sp. ALI-22-I]
MPPRRTGRSADEPSIPKANARKVWKFAFGDRPHRGSRANEFIECATCRQPLLAYLQPELGTSRDQRTLAVPVNDRGEPVHPTPACDPRPVPEWTWDKDRIATWFATHTTEHDGRSDGDTADPPA